MPTDIFRTGFEMDTSDLKKGEQALDGVAVSAKKTDKAIDDLDDSTKKAKKTFSETTITVEEFADALDIDSKDFDATQKSIFSGLKRSGKSFEMAGLKVDRFKEDQLIAGNTISKTGQVLNKQGVEVLNLTRNWQDLQARLRNSRAGFESAQKSAMTLKSTVGGANKSFKLAGNSAQMLGFQLQDVAVQAQMGASWFTIIGQQGSQLASVLGSKGALLGAAIAVASALGGILFKAMGNVKINAEEMREAIDATTESIKMMDKITKTFLSKEETKSVAERTKEIDKLNIKISETEEALKKAQAESEKYNQSNPAARVGKTAQKGLNSARFAIIKHSNSLIDMRQKVEELNASIDKSRGIISDIVDSNKITEHYQNILDSLKITAKAEDEKWIAIQKGIRERRKELDILKKIEMSTNSILGIENDTREAAIKKGRAQEQSLKNTQNAAFESQLESLKDFGKSEKQIEQERYAESLELLRNYAEEKGWLEQKIKDNELLLESDHQKKLLDIEKDAITKRQKNRTEDLDNIKALAGVFSDLTTLTTAKKKAQLQSDLSNTQKFSSAEIAAKEKTLKAIFEKEKNANMGRIAINTAVALSESLTNPAKFVAVGLAGAAQLAAANAQSYSGGANIPNSVSPPPSVANTTNNSGGNIINFNVNNSGGGDLDEDRIQQYFKDGGILFDNDTEQAQVLR